MPLQRLTPDDFTTLENPGVRSRQLVWPGNAPDAALTVTRVTMQPGAKTHAATLALIGVRIPEPVHLHRRFKA